MSRATTCLLLMLALGSGCVGFSEGGEACQRDDDCKGEYTNTGECVAAGTSLSVFLTWTVNGVTPSPQDASPCDRIEELEVAFDSNVEPGPAYRPVPCELGQVTYTKMPPYLDSATITALDSAGLPLARATTALEPQGETRATLDLQL